MSRWTWSKIKEQALQLVFEGRQTRDQIALTCAVPARTLDYWIAHPDFQERLQQLYTDIEAATRGKPYITKTQRLIGLSSMAEQARVEFEARPWLREVRPLPQKASVRIRRRVVDADPPPGDPSAAALPEASSAASDATEDELTEPLDAIVNESFNRDAFESFRGALDDIAKELGARKQVTELGGSLNVNEQVMFYLPEPEQPPHEASEADHGASDNDSASS